MLRCMMANWNFTANGVKSRRKNKENQQHHLPPLRQGFDRLNLAGSGQALSQWERVGKTRKMAYWRHICRANRPFREKFVTAYELIFVGLHIVPEWGFMSPESKFSIVLLQTRLESRATVGSYKNSHIIKGREICTLMRKMLKSVQIVQPEQQKRWHVFQRLI
jgi:hypothetical protein